MSSFWESKYLSSEKSVQFLQQTHAEILKGLHEEINNLQKQCSDYALKLSMRASTEIEREEFDKKFKSFNIEYLKKDTLINDQQMLISERNKNIKNLTERIKQLEKRLDVEAHPKDQVIKQLKKELEHKNAQIAHLTYQLHNASKANKSSINIKSSDLRESLSYIGNASSVPADIGILSPGRKKKSQRVTTQRSEDREPEYLIENQLLYSKSTIANINERKMSSESLVFDPTDLSENSGFMSKGVPNSLKTFAQQRLTASMSSANSAVSDRSEVAHLNDLKNKLLPPVVKRSGDVMVPDPKPFLQSMSSTLHSRSRKELLQRRTLITLPQIKSFDNHLVNHLAVESPLKSVNHHGQHVDHNSSSTN